MRRLERLLRPRSIAVIGGGAWCRNVVRTSKSIGFDGAVWPVHPTKSEIEGLQTYPSVDALPQAPDAAFIGVNRYATIECLSSLSRRGAGGAVCFASGFAEATAQLADGADLQTAMLSAAGAMPFLGPNCYGLINYLDGAALWPDLHGGQACQTGAAIITQSSNVAINLTMQNRGLPLAYVVTAGNQAQTDLAEIGMELLRDPRVNCLGLYVEGINNINKLEQLSNLSHELGKPISAVKIGLSEQARIATVSHTASMTGSHAGAQALLKRLGIAQMDTLPALLELLKIWHVAGPLGTNRIASASCSGGEASLMADLAARTGVSFPPLNDKQSNALRSALGPKVALANPLDYHTYIWNDPDAMEACFLGLMDRSLALGLIVLDLPRADRCDASDWDIALSAIESAAQKSPIPLGVVASLPETMPEETANRLISNGIIPFCGMDHALSAIAKARSPAPHSLALARPDAPTTGVTLTESEAKARLQPFSLRVPRAMQVDTAAGITKAAQHLQAPYVLKATGMAHKSEAGGVHLGLRTADELEMAARKLNNGPYLVEEMIENSVAELLLSVTVDPAHGYLLTIGAGGTQTELLNDTATLLLPVTQSDVASALQTLRCAPLLDGYRGAAPADHDAIWRAVDAVQSFVLAHRAQLLEVEINPLICTPTDAIAADALIVMGDPQ